MEDYRDQYEAEMWEDIQRMDEPDPEPKENHVTVGQNFTGDRLIHFNGHLVGKISWQELHREYCCTLFAVAGFRKECTFWQNPTSATAYAERTLNRCKFMNKAFLPK